METSVSAGKKQALEKKAYRVYAADFVTTEEGTESIQDLQRQGLLVLGYDHAFNYQEHFQNL